jgi:hypothetical protein
MNKVKIGRVLFAVTPVGLVTKYAKHCVTYNSPAKPEDGLQRAIYQLSPTLHFEAVFWVWIEQKKVHSYAMILSCYHEEKEFLEFTDELYKIRRIGNTEDRMHAGFAQPVIPSSGVA